MEFRHLRYFLVLAEELHFGRAAQRLAISQPPLSLNIQQLESSVGAQLFERNSRGVRLTPAGEALVPRARALLEQAQEAASHARDVARGLEGRLQLGFVGAMLYRGLPQLLRRFQDSHPRLRVVLRELNSQDQLVELVHGQLDVGFVHNARLPRGVSQLLYAQEPFVCCLPSDHALARRRRIDLAELQEQPFVLFARSVSPDYHERILSVCAAAGFYPEVRHEVRHWLSVVSLVSQGLGVALVPASLKRSRLDGAVFVPLSVSGSGAAAESHAYCVWREAQANAASLAFVAAVREAVDQSTPRFSAGSRR